MPRSGGESAWPESLPDFRKLPNGRWASVKNYTQIFRMFQQPLDGAAQSDFGLLLRCNRTNDEVDEFVPGLSAPSLGWSLVGQAPRMVEVPARTGTIVIGPIGSAPGPARRRIHDETEVTFFNP